MNSSVRRRRAFCNPYRLYSKFQLGTEIVGIRYHHRDMNVLLVKSPLEEVMDLTTILIIVLIVFLLGGGFYGRGRWY